MHSSDLTAHTLSHMGLTPRRTVAAGTGSHSPVKPTTSTKHFLINSHETMTEVQRTCNIGLILHFLSFFTVVVFVSCLVFCF